MPEVLTARDGGVLTITLNRPEVFNAFNRALHAALRTALEEAADPAVRAVVITGAGEDSAPARICASSPPCQARCATSWRRPTTRTSASSGRSRSR